MSTEAATKARHVLTPGEDRQSYSDKAEMLRRVDEIEQLIIFGARTFQIVQHARTKWSIKRTQAHLYIRKAREGIAKLSGIDRATEIALAMLRYDAILYKAMLPGKRQVIRKVKLRDENGKITGDKLEIIELDSPPELLVAKMVVDSKCKLLGLNAPNRHEHSLTRAETTHAETMTQAERQTAIAEFVLKYQDSIRGWLKQAEKAPEQTSEKKSQVLVLDKAKELILLSGPPGRS